MSTHELGLSMSGDGEAYVNARQLANLLRAGVCTTALAATLDRLALELEAREQIEAMCGPTEPERCEVCGSLGDCDPNCDLLKCGECGGVGFVPNYDAPLDIHQWSGVGLVLPSVEGEQWYEAKPCTCPLGAAAVDPSKEN